MKKKIIDIQNLSIGFPKLLILKNINLSLYEEERLGIVGQSGSGKTLLIKSILHLLPKGISIRNGSILFQEVEITHVKEEEMRNLRGKEISIIFQDPMTYLNPTMNIGNQIKESYQRSKASTQEKEKKIAALLEQIGISDPKLRMRQFPHQLSGGMRQRIMLAIALALEPKILIADEPTTSLDTTIQAQIFNFLCQLKQSMILVTHNLDLAASICQRIAVMHEGSIVEEAETDQLLHHPQHPFTQQLLKARPHWKSEPIPC